jgi:WD40 repeat protein
MNSHDNISVANSMLTHRVAELAERLQAGEIIDLKAFCANCPEQFEQLEMLLPTLQVVVNLENSLADSNIATGATVGPVVRRSSDPAHPASNRLEGTRGPASTGVLGDFRILREIGRGGMGVVYEAEQISLGRRVALKVLPYAAILDQRQLARFKSEARAAALLHHTNIVPVFSVGHESGVHYYAMQYIDGITLAQLITQLTESLGRPQSDSTRDRAHDQTSLATNTPYISGNSNGPAAHDAAMAIVTQRSADLSAYYRSIARLGIQAAEALQHAHQHGVVHRDIKPANLMLDTSGNLWITDFGLARLETDVGLTMTGDLIGTLRYMSPEQAAADSGHIDHRTDVYSLGITLYELLALELMIDGKGRRSMLRQIVDEEIRSLARLDYAVPKDLDTIVLKAAAKSAKERYATAQELADDLRRFLNHEPIAARRATLLHRAGKWVQRHRSLVAVSAASLLFSIAVLAGNLFWSAARERERLLELANQERQEALHAKRQLQKLTYVRDIGRIEHHRLCQNADLVRSLLEKYRPSSGETDLRGFEWHYFSELLQSLQGAQQRVINAHARQIYCLTFSNSGRLLASSSEDAQAKLWKYPSMELHRTFVGHTSDVNWIAFSPDDRTVATCSDDGTVRTWDVETGNERLKFAAYPPWAEDEGQSIAYRIAFSPDGKVLATMHKVEAKLWDADTGKSLGTLPGRGLAFARAHRLVATAPDTSGITFWEIDTLQQLASISIRENERIQLESAQFNATDSQLLVAGEGEYLTVWYLRWDGSKLLKSSRHRIWAGRGPLEGVSFSGDSSIAATAGFHGNFCVWDPRTQCRIGGAYDHSERGWSAIFSPDQSCMLTSGADGKIRLWAAKSEQLAQWIHLPAYIALSGKYLPGGDTFVCLAPRRTWRSEGDQFSVLDSKTWSPVATASVRTDSKDEHDSQASLYSNALAISPSGRQVAVTGGGGVFLWDRTAPKLTFRRIVEWQNASEPSSYPAPVDATGSAVFLDERTLAVIRDGVTTIVDLNRGAIVDELEPPGITESARRLETSPDHRFLAIGGEQGSVWLYDRWKKSWGPQGRAAARAILAIEFLSPHGLLALGSEDGMIAVWDIETSTMLHQLFGHMGPVTALSWNAGQKRLASAGLNDSGRVRLWDVDIGRQLCSFDTEANCQLYDVTFAPNGRGLTACGVCSMVGKVFHWQLGEAVQQNAR